MNPSMGLFVAYFGTSVQYPETKHHTIVLGPRYRGLLDDIFKRRKLADDFSLYLHAPTRSDPTLAPAGHEAFYVLSPVPNNRSGIDWNTRTRTLLPASPRRTGAAAAAGCDEQHRDVPADDAVRVRARPAVRGRLRVRAPSRC
jgi:phytoene dehydrogenase-like protein